MSPVLYKTRIFLMINVQLCKYETSLKIEKIGNYVDMTMFFFIHKYTGIAINKKNKVAFTA